MSETDSKSDTRLTQADSRPVLYELLDKDGKWSGYESASAQLLADVAKTLWPDQKQDPGRLGDGWDVQICAKKS